MDRAPSQRSAEDEADPEAETEALDASDLRERSVADLQRDVIGDFVLDAQRYFRTKNPEALSIILQGLVDQGLSISGAKAEMIQNRLGDNMNEAISTLLGKLTSGELEPVPFAMKKTKAGGATSFNDLDVEAIERWIARLEEKGEPTKNLKRHLLVTAIRAKDIPKTEQIFERLQAEGFVFTSGVYAQLIELYASADRLEDALKTYKHVRANFPEFNIDPVKTILIAQAYVNNDRLDDAIKFLDESKPTELPDERAFNYQSACWRLLNSIAEKGDDVAVNKLFDSLVGNGYFVPSNVSLGPLIKVHLVRDDIAKAIDKFEEISKKYRSTPWKNELACRLINSEDAINLQRITDLSTEVHGEVNSLYDLVFSFIECGRIRQARKILETPGLRSRSGRIGYACERFKNEGMPTALEGLVEATKDLSHIDRASIYFSLLQTYIKDKEPEKALGLWTTMQEENVSPTDEFLIKLAKYLKSEGLEVPFHVPVVERAKVVSESQRDHINAEEKATSVKPIPNNVANLRAVIRTGDADAMLAAKKKLTPADELSATVRSELVEGLVKGGKLQEATNEVIGMLGENIRPIPRVFRFYLNRIASSGDSDSLLKVGEYLSSDAKKLVSFDNRVCHSFVASGKVDEYLSKLEAAIDNANTPEQIAKVEEEFPRGGSVGILEKDPANVDKFHKIALKYAEKNVLGPMNVLWNHHFANKDPKADLIFKEHLTNTPRLMFQKVVQTARDNQDAELMTKLINLLANAKVSEGAIGNAYSCLLDIYATKNDPENCLKATADCVKDVCFEHVNRTALQRAKECVEKAGKKFPHTIPEKKTSNQDSSSSSSSSSSDDEVTQKKKQLA